MLKFTAAVVLALTLSGCFSASSPLTVGPRAVASAAALPACANMYRVCGEASIASTSTGRLYVANGFGRSLATSADGGASWTNLTLPSLPEESVRSWTDTDSLVNTAPDGRVIYSAIVASYANAIAAGAITLIGLHVAVSNDEGKTWPVNRLISFDDQHQTLGADRQWVTAGMKGELYLTYGHGQGSPAIAFTPIPGAPSALLATQIEVARSDDGGRSWGDFRPIATGTYYNSGQSVIDAEGALLVPTFYSKDDGTGSYEGTFLVWRSTDRAATFTKETVIGPAKEETNWFPAIAAAPDGGLVAAWARASGEIVVSTRAHGATAWSAPVAWTRPNETAATGPAMLARTGGGIVMSYATKQERPDGEPLGNLTLAWGDAKGVAGRSELAHDQLFASRGANGDFTTLAALPDGRFASAMAEFHPGDYASWVQAFVATAS